MLIGFVGTQSGMTQFQKDEFVKILKLKECSELYVYDVGGANTQAILLAEANEVKVFTIYPPDDIRKRYFNFDSSKSTRKNEVITSYIIPYHTDIKVRWMPIDKYMGAHKDIISKVEFLIACPKEFKFTIQSAVWGVIKYAWANKKDNTIIIPPVSRPEE